MFTDPIADMLARMRNAQMRQKASVLVPSSRMKLAILDVMMREGYIRSYEVEQGEGFPMVRVEIKYFHGRPVIRAMKRVSKPSVQMYASVRKMPSVANGLGTVILSTPKGVLSDREARAQHVGGKILLTVC